MSKYHFLFLSLSSTHTLTLNPLTFSISFMLFVFVLFFCFSCPMSNFFYLFSLWQNTQTFTGMHGKEKKEVPFFATPSLAAVLVHPHTLASLSSLFFYWEGQRHSERERVREEKEKWSYRFELHTVSILPSLNDLNKEFNTAGSE